MSKIDIYRPQVNDNHIGWTLVWIPERQNPFLSGLIFINRLWEVVSFDPYISCRHAFTTSWREFALMDYAIHYSLYIYRMFSFYEEATVPTNDNQPRKKENCLSGIWTWAYPCFAGLKHYRCHPILGTLISHNFLLSFPQLSSFPSPNLLFLFLASQLPICFPKPSFLAPFPDIRLISYQHAFLLAQLGTLYRTVRSKRHLYLVPKWWVDEKEWVGSCVVRWFYSAL